MLVEGTRRVVAFALDVNASLSPPARIHRVDIGGGLPVTYDADQPAPSMGRYAAELERRCPELFTGRWRLVTEFGRYYHATTAWAVSRVEYVKRTQGRTGGRTSAALHLGADMFLRRAYAPDHWPHAFTVLDRDGQLKQGDPAPVTIVGPLCFQGDVLAHDILLPPVEEGDSIVVHDAGAYTMAMWSRYNSRQMPAVVGYEDRGETMTLLRKRETEETLVRFWSTDPNQ
jgi:diaminopimelate decarboxylase